jgi:Trypsin
MILNYWLSDERSSAVRFGKWMGTNGFGRLRASGRAALVSGVLAILGLALVPAPGADATGARLAGTAASSRTRDRVLEAYRRDRALDALRQHARRGGASHARAAVVGGTEASIEQLPWQVVVFAEFEVDGEEEALLCGGSIIDLSHILTAAHCAYNPVTGQQLTSASFVILAGASRLTVEEIKYGATVEGRFVGGARIHPDFDYAAGPGTPDDVAMLQLAEPLTASSGVRPIGLSSSASSPPEGTDVTLSGFGEENPTTEELNGNLYSIGMTLGFSRECGGEDDALFLCARNGAGSACNGDSGGGVVDGSPSTLIGFVDTVEVVGGEPCRDGALNGFVNLAAPEVRDFIEGSEDPPLAPRGGGIVIRGVPTAGQSLSCEPGSWSGGPTFTYAFIDSASGQVLQQGSSPTYALSGADVGRTIFCEVQATDAGGTGVARTHALAPIEPAPVVTPPPPPTGGGGTAPPTGGGGTAPPVGGSSDTEPVGGQGTGGSGGGAGGGVLGYTNTNIGSAQIAALLGQELTPAGKKARVATLLKASGFTVRFKALEAGTAVIDWYRIPTGATLAGKARVKPILVASGQMTFSAAGTTKIEVRLTAAGIRLLKSAGSLKLIAEGRFTPRHQSPVTATRVFVLRR